jgi:hypothetical protein
MVDLRSSRNRWFDAQAASWFGLEACRNGCSTGFGHGVRRDWLDTITRQISTKLASVWTGRSDFTDRWLHGVCMPDIERSREPQGGYKCEKAVERPKPSTAAIQ